jgi:hypothetical protein
MGNHIAGLERNGDLAGEVVGRVVQDALGEAQNLGLGMRTKASLVGATIQISLL